jgi:hypothetical protein
MYKNKTWLKNKYIDERLSTREIGEICGVCHHTIRGNLNKYNIPIRTSSEAQMGIYNHFWGKKASKETRLKLSKVHKGKKLWTEEQKKQISERMKGENNPQWKGGITSLAKQINKNYKYRQWRDDVFTRDNFTCQMCGKKGGKLNAHHIKSFSSILQYYEITTLEEALECDELWNINNGITLCEKCHIKIHKKGTSYPLGELSYEQTI